MRSLNRVVEWTSEGIRYEADPRHAESITKMMGVAGGKSLSTPVVKAEARDDDEEGELLEPQGATQYRAMTARGIYLSQDRSEIGFAVKELSRGMARPRRENWEALKRFARYLVGREREVKTYAYQRRPGGIEVWTDTDYAGCKRTR